MSKSRRSTSAVAVTHEHTPPAVSMKTPRTTGSRYGAQGDYYMKLLTQNDVPCGTSFTPSPDKAQSSIWKAVSKPSELADHRCDHG
jgi:hypothetical protein